MKRILNTLLVLIGLSIIAVGTIYFIYPGVILTAVQTMAANNAGLEHRQVDINGYKAHYFEGGSENQTTLVLIHPFADDKNSFVTSVRELTNDYRVILPDLQAHGNNKQVLGRDYSIEGQVDFIESVLQKLNANRVFIGGNEMGGHIALAYAANSPEKTLGLVLLNSTGVHINNTSSYTPFPNQVDSAYFSQKFAQLYVTPPAYPKPVLQHLANQLNPRISFFNSMLKQVDAGKNFQLRDTVQSIKAPTLILWGQQDPSLSSDDARLLQQSLTKAQLINFDNAGRSPQFEIPDRVTSELSIFLKGFE